MKLLLLTLATSAGLLVMTGAHARDTGGATALCADGTSSHAATEKGACSRHGGVKTWYGASPSVAKMPAPLPRMPAAPTPVAPPSPVAKSPSAALPAAGATALCVDGTSSHAMSEKGACSRHGGIKTWFGKSMPQASAPAASAPTATAPTPMSHPMRTTPSVTPAAQPPTMSKPIPSVARTPNMTPPQPAVAGPGTVWVNTKSKVYHCSNDRWYGKTKQGQYMTQAAAQAQGFRPEHGKACM